MPVTLFRRQMIRRRAGNCVIWATLDARLVRPSTGPIEGAECIARS